MVEGKKRLIGIDFGTTNSRVCYTQYHSQRHRYVEPQVVEFDGKPGLRSIVCLDEQGKQAIAFGHTVVEEGFHVRYPQRIHQEFKLFIGENEVARRCAVLLFAEMHRGLTRALGVTELDPQRHTVIVGAPAQWAPELREYTIQCAEAGGIPSPRLEREPVGAMLYHHFLGDLIYQPEPEYSLIVDFGGGTTDFVLVKTEAGGQRPEIVCTYGEKYGGRDFDLVLHRYILDRYWHDGELPSELSTRLTLFARRFKESFSARVSRGEQSYRRYCGLPGIDNEVLLNLPDFESPSMAGPLIDRFLSILTKGLGQSGIAAVDISRVILTGGSTRWYFVEQAIRNIFGDKRVHRSAQPEQTIAKGLALVPSLERIRDHRVPERGLDHEHVLQLTLDQAQSGGAIPVKFEGPDGRPREIEVDIPPKVTDGFRTRVMGQGTPGKHGGPPGDLWLTIEIVSLPVEPQPILPFSQFRAAYHSSGPIPRGRPKWRVEPESEICTSPAIVEGTVCVGTVSGVVAFDAATGDERWMVLTEGSAVTAPSIADGVVYVIARPQGVIRWQRSRPKAFIYGIDAKTGAVRRSYPFELRLAKDAFVRWLGEYSAPAVVGQSMYIGTPDRFVLAIDTVQGQLKWRVKTGKPVLVSPAVVKDLVYVGSTDKHQYALHVNDGQVAWKSKTGGEIRGIPAVWEGTVYNGSGDGYVYALDAETGSLKWRSKIGSRIRSSLAVADGIVAVQSDDGYIYAVDALSGSIRWRSRIEAEEVYRPGGSSWDAFQKATKQLAGRVSKLVTVPPSPAIVNGTVYVGSWDKHLYALDASKGILLWRYKTDALVMSPVVYKGVVYISSSDGHLHAIE